MTDPRVVTGLIPKNRDAEKAGAKAPIGSIWHRLGWTLLGLDENERRARSEHGEQCVNDAVHFERSLPYRFRRLSVELGAVVTPGDQGIVIYNGFKVVATLSRVDAEVLSPQDEKALRRAFNRLPT